MQLLISQKSNKKTKYLEKETLLFINIDKFIYFVQRTMTLTK